MSDYPADLAYSKDHAWAKISGNQGTVGITKFASEQLGDIMTVSFDVKLPGNVAIAHFLAALEKHPGICGLRVHSPSLAFLRRKFTA